MLALPRRLVLIELNFSQVSGGHNTGVSLVEVLENVVADPATEYSIVVAVVEGKQVVVETVELVSEANGLSIIRIDAI